MRLPRALDGWLAGLVGLAAFLLYTGGGSILWPTHTGWLMTGDPAAGWLGWQFFRDTPLWQWPLGANPGYGMELGSSIVFSDSVPLLAFLFKPLSPWLPAQFQYFGLWLAACFVLQAWFGWRIALRVTGDRWLALGGACFFAIAPIACQRLMGHYALAGHWLLLAAVFLYLREVAPRQAWLALLATAALVHAYLLVMCLLVFGADLVQRAWLRQRSPVASAALLLAAALVVGLVMWAAGYFMVGGLKGVGISNTDFGLYHMNLLAPVDPDGGWSRWLPDLPGGPGDYEGFAYLGTGMLALALVAVVAALANRRFGPVRTATLIPLLGLAAAALAVAVSNHVALGGSELFAYPLPGFVEPLTSAFRVSGRFAWLPVYLAYAAILWTLARRLPPTTARTLLGLALALQLFDGAGSWRHYGDLLTRPAAWKSGLDSALWSPLARDARRLVVVPPRNNPDQWVGLAELAMRHRLQSGALSVARVDARREAAAQARRAHELQDGPADRDALYIVQDEAAWQRLLRERGGEGFLGDIDGLHVYAPAGCAACPPATSQTARRRALARPAGSWRFTSADPGRALLVRGWSGAEPWGTWSDGPSAELVIPLDPSANHGDLELEIEGTAYLGAGREAQRVELSVNGRPLARWRYVRGNDDRLRSVIIARELATAGGASLHVVLHFPDAIAPASAGDSADPRLLGLGLVALRLRDLGQ